MVQVVAGTGSAVNGLPIRSNLRLLRLMVRSSFAIVVAVIVVVVVTTSSATTTLLTSVSSLIVVVVVVPSVTAATATAMMLLLLMMLVVLLVVVGLRFVGVVGLVVGGRCRGGSGSGFRSSVGLERSKREAQPAAVRSMRKKKERKTQTRSTS